MAVQFTIEKEVTFAQTDMAGVMHFSEFFPMMEECEHRFFRSLGVSVAPSSGSVLWPRKNCSCEYFKPLRFQDRVRVRLTLLKQSTRSLSFGFTFMRANDRELMAEGRMTTICCITNGEGNLEPTSIPKALVDKIQEKSSGDTTHQ